MREIDQVTVVLYESSPRIYITTINLEELDVHGIIHFDTRIIDSK